MSRIAYAKAVPEGIRALAGLDRYVTKIVDLALAVSVINAWNPRAGER